MAIRKVGFIDRLILMYRFRIFKKRFDSNRAIRVSLKRLRQLNMVFSDLSGFSCSHIREVQEGQYSIAVFDPFECYWFVFSIDGEFPHLLSFEELPKIEWYATRKF